MGLLRTPAAVAALIHSAVLQEKSKSVELSNGMEAEGGEREIGQILAETDRTDLSGLWGAFDRHWTKNLRSLKGFRYRFWLRMDLFC